MQLNDRPLAPAPYDMLPSVPSFSLTSASFQDGSELPALLTGEGSNVSPQLTWTGFPPQTQSFLVNCFDPDAPTPSGFWHWNVVNLPKTITELSLGAGSGDQTLPGGAFHVRNDIGSHNYTGPMPPEGDRPHRYYFAVHALSVPSLPVKSSSTPTEVAFNVLFHTLARGVLLGTYQR